MNGPPLANDSEQSIGQAGSADAIPNYARGPNGELKASNASMPERSLCLHATKINLKRLTGGWERKKLTLGTLVQKKVNESNFKKLEEQPQRV